MLVCHSFIQSINHYKAILLFFFKHVCVCIDDIIINMRVLDVNLTGVFSTLRAAANSVENNGRIMVIGGERERERE
jgi:hypothetical protein